MLTRDPPFHCVSSVDKGQAASQSWTAESRQGQVHEPIGLYRSPSLAQIQSAVVSLYQIQYGKTWDTYNLH